MFVFAKSVKLQADYCLELWINLASFEVLWAGWRRDVMCHCQLTKHTLFSSILYFCPVFEAVLLNFALSAIPGWIPLFVSLYFFPLRKLSMSVLDGSSIWGVFKFFGTFLRQIRGFRVLGFGIFLLSAVCGRLCNDQRQDIFGCFDQGKRLWSQKSKFELSLKCRKLVTTGKDCGSPLQTRKQPWKSRSRSVSLRESSSTLACI